MSETAEPSKSLTATAHLTGATKEAVLSAEKKLIPKGLTRSIILSEAIAAGLPAVLKRHQRRKANLSFTACVEAVVRNMPGIDITRSEVIAGLTETYPKLVREYSEDDLARDVISILRRLANRKLLTLTGTKKVKGPKAFRTYQVNVYRLVVQE
jgi:hypothetical protein